MRVVYRSPGFPPDVGGIETLAGQLLPALRERGHEFLVIAGGESAIRSDGAAPDVPVRRFPFTAALAARDLRAIADLRGQARRAEQEFEPDLVHLNFGGPDAFFHLFRRRTPTLLTLHAPIPEVGHESESMTARLARGCDWTTAVSQAVLDDVLPFAPDIADRSSVLYNGVPAPGRPPTPPPLDPPRILCLGRVSPEKGFDVAIDALPRVRASHPEARLTIAGDGHALDSLRRRAHARGVADAVDFAGAVAHERVPELIEASTVVAIPSRWREPFCLVAVEAAQAARPVVATGIAGLRETVADGETGTLVALEDAAALGRALVELLDRPERAAAMGLAGRERAARLFGMDAYIDAHDRLYRRLAAPSAASSAAPERS
jgi:glycogen(starch) synthase